MSIEEGKGVKPGVIARAPAVAKGSERPTKSSHQVRSLGGEFLAVARTKSAARHLLCVAALIVLQTALLVYHVHPRSHVVSYSRNYAFLGAALQPVMYFALALGFLLSSHAASAWRVFAQHASAHRWQRFLPWQLVSYAAVAVSAGMLIPTDYMSFNVAPPAWTTIFMVALIAAVFAAGILSLLLAAPPSYWMHFVRTEALSIGLALAFAISAYLIGELTQQSWDLLARPTMLFSKALLDLFYADVVIDVPTTVLGTSTFQVSIDPECSGYEGIGLITAFLAWYILSFRGELRLPNAFLLFPAAAGVIWVCNAVRIAALITIGVSYSPEVAMQGFHSNAGWISFVCVAAGIVWAAHRIPFFTNGASSPAVWQIDAGRAPLIPFLVLLAATLVSSAFSTKFPWLYPVRVTTTGFAIVALWNRLGLRGGRIDRFSIGTGLGVFVLWIVLVPPSPELDSEFEHELFSVSGTASAGWILARLVGACLIVPIAEELAFRQYVLAFFGDAVNKEASKPRFRWTGMAVSSLLFGAMHSSWIAGTLAGVAYYIVRYRRGKVADAVLAHATTNLCLSLYVLAFGHWSLW